MSNNGWAWKMIKKPIYIALIVMATPFLQIGGCLFLANRDRQNAYETKDIQGDRKTWFVEAFMPGVSPQDVLTLSQVQTGGREPIHFGVMEMTTNGVAQLRANTKHAGTGTFSDGSISHLFGHQYAGINQTIAQHVKVNWWSMDPTRLFEARSAHWKGDHSSRFFIPTNGTPIYFEAVIY